jgi:hypothetical protein
MYSLAASEASSADKNYSAHAEVLLEQKRRQVKYWYVYDMSDWWPKYLHRMLKEFI